MMLLVIISACFFEVDDGSQIDVVEVADRTRNFAVYVWDDVHSEDWSHKFKLNKKEIINTLEE